MANALPAFADPITLVSSNRSVVLSFGATLQNQDALSNGTGLIGPDGTVRMSGSLFSEVMGHPTFNGHGSTTASHESTSVSLSAQSQVQYSTTFDVNAPQAYAFRASFATSGTDATDRSLWSAALFLAAPGPSPADAFSFSGVDSRDLLTFGLLQPGRYGLNVFSVSDSFGVGTGSTRDDFHFSLEFADAGVPSATPEPASLLLFGTGIAGLFARRRMQQRPA